VVGTTFNSNVAGPSGGDGAIFWGAANLANTSFVGNTSTGTAGGAAFHHSSAKQLVNVLFARNTATGVGFDIDGQARPAGGAYDIGFDEWAPFPRDGKRGRRRRRQQHAKWHPLCPDLRGKFRRRHDSHALSGCRPRICLRRLDWRGPRWHRPLCDDHGRTQDRHGPVCRSLALPAHYPSLIASISGK
jgi:hypothetical protein